jgi:hypothetical protein
MDASSRCAIVVGELAVGHAHITQHALKGIDLTGSDCDEGMPPCAWVEGIFRLSPVSGLVTTDSDNVVASGPLGSPVNR